ncbi:hypothetical protein GCM10007421_31940 [Halopseudomonas oceani]|jgi:hypothetical protein|uniref:DUF465 domain-containing protein n=1 Tax=Halopseudomonas oceani TaxID=1708783 RepID=A0A2P4ES20_9GAMM|nr:DUF465 domain-containing protein [Halopseudomonas oceani]POB01781.1 hypothetical protein C1949_15685 [Halopseudomonas oceani]GGE54997.1 hypothetical protein GCM10007421_31940 [Halopseudomonas oceani]
MGIANHELHGEFPQYSDLIDQLAEADAHFKEQLHEYASLDREIMRLEKRESPVEDTTFQQMKKQRAHLKDQLYNTLLKAAQD